MKTVNVHEAKTTVSRLLEDVERGETIIIARNGKPIAELTAITKRSMAAGVASIRAAHRVSTAGLSSRDLIDDGRR